MTGELSKIPASELHAVMGCLQEGGNPVIFDFTSANTELAAIDLNDEQTFTDYIFSTIRRREAPYGIGRHYEDRTIYERSEVFGTHRSVHLGIDIWAPAGSAVYAPLGGIVHSYADNNQHGDYGPTIILQHSRNGAIFHSLYGHLSRESLSGLEPGMPVSAGSRIATLGHYEENVHWPPHLHFQLILDMEGKWGDYPGVCARSERERYLKNCPDPNLLLRIDALK